LGSCFSRFIYQGGVPVYLLGLTYPALLLMSPNFMLRKL